mmetsp:Transcript_830/g.2573  ORF Transcript_830/g.2573 Transcript_830/m.2573 type:complete len:373 (+) Transcript_830:225-1343(+)|eukprot:CAMPEP_0206140194 /NCGR_PEP_ID=MMETSP1473-20131121/8685_1 /ASSEMBLY_ACC=CAM_ASM_001109 /TAXON_ID=1461547 /ORGANISM="Stichococcus sp, Strain RCC1054" /LENGTH=372 /DNA_ID=CAMNT_0053534263 /DNA_START=141 /DNA_END=1259 /DNA_ORIENTATION=+
MGKRGHDGGGGGAKKKWQPASWTGKVIPAGTKGCLVSCVSGKEQQASREAQDLMIQYVESLKPAKQEEAAPAGSDIAALIADEVADLKKPEGKLVTYHSTGITGLAYLAFTGAAGDISPVDFVTAMSREIKATKQCKSRLCMRFMPVEYSCQASLEDIRSVAGKLVPIAFPPRDVDAEPETFSVHYEHRASAKIDRKQIIDAFVDHVPKQGYKVSLDGAQRTILVQLIKSCCTIAFVRDYRDLAKFNIRELSGWVDPSKMGSEQQPPTSDKAAEGATAAAEQQPAAADIVENDNAAPQPTDEAAKDASNAPAAESASAPEQTPVKEAELATPAAAASAAPATEALVPAADVGDASKPAEAVADASVSAKTTA